MYRKEINERSPLRVFERSIQGGLGKGNVGVVMSRAGAGKTAFLVGVALDVLMRGGKVLHVSLDKPIDRVRGHYDDIFMELAHIQSLEDEDELSTTYRDASLRLQMATDQHSAMTMELEELASSDPKQFDREQSEQQEKQ